MLVICGLGIIAVLYTPIWRIELNAPQYPEGLCLQIHANDIKGNVDIINGLNHYIGMKSLKKADFPEFTILPYCILFFSVAFIFAGLLNKKKGFYTVFFFFVAFGVIAMADFWKWEYNYGHNLNPNAAIIVPGMAYQPPLIGFKQLLNFGAYSIPDIGGWIFIGCGAILLTCFLSESKLLRIIKKNKQNAAMLFIPLLLLTSCTSGPEPITIGKDNCSYCKMTISDPRFGAEIVTSTGKTYKFDDIKCAELFLGSLPNEQKKDVAIYLTDFCGSHSLIASGKSYLLKSAELKCPMDGQIIAFKNQDSMNTILKAYHGEQINFTIN